MLHMDNAHSELFSQKQKRSFHHNEHQQQYDQPISRDSYSQQLFQTTPSTQQFQQQLQQENCVDQLRSEVDKIIPRKKGKGVIRSFSRLEDELILHLVHLFGPKFRKFIKFFSGRQAMTLKNRYYKCLRTEYLRGKEEAARCQEEKQQTEKEIRNNIQQNPCIPQQQQIQQCLEELDFSEDNKMIMGRCIDNLFAIFKTMYQ